MKLTILISLYNKEKYIERCLKSLIEQDVSPNMYEIIIVDDGSKDSGGLIVQNYAKKHQNIKLISQLNQGASAARNRGLEAASGDYLYFLDADDYLNTNVLNYLLELGEQNDLEILEFNTKQIIEGSIFNSVPLNPENVSVHVMDGYTYVAEYGLRNEAWRYIVLKSFLMDTGIKFIEGTFYEDVIFTASLFLKAKRMAKVNLDIHRYVVVENSIVTNRDSAHNLKFINGMVYAIEHFYKLINGLNSSHVNCHKVTKKLKGKQQAFVFALIIRTLKYRLLSFDDLKKILLKLNKLEAYPIDLKAEGIRVGKIRHRIYNLTYGIIFNNKVFLYLGMSIMRLIPSR